MIRTRELGGTGAVLVVAALLLGQVGEEEAIITFPLRVHVLVDPARATDVERQVELANELFAPARVRFVVAQQEAWPPEGSVSFERVLDLSHIRADDRAGIDVFVVTDLGAWARGPHGLPAGFTFTQSLRDGLGLGRMRMVFPGERFSDCIFVVSDTLEFPVLAHELGHLFGLEHTSSDGLMMERRGSGPFSSDEIRFTSDEIAAIRAAAAAAAARGQPLAIHEPVAASPSPR